MKKQNIQISFPFILWLIMASCANIVTPTGGQKDVMPPIVKETSPLPGTKDFSGRTVHILFDEFVKLNDVSKQVIVSPFTPDPPDVKTKGKYVVVSFNDTLRYNTTYSVSFGNSIGDITENNILKDYRFVFSTGDVIDSLIIKGVVKNAFTQKSESDVFVMLYTLTDDSIPLKETPYYMARTREDGTFYFTSLRDAKYKMFALKDMNNDYMFDQPNEDIAFLDTLVVPEVMDTLPDSVAAHKKNTVFHLDLFEEKPSRQRLMKAYPAMYGKVNLVFAKPLGTFAVKEVMKKGSGYKKELNKTRDTLSLWMNNPDDDSLIIQVLDNNEILDTAEIELIKKSFKTNIRSGGVILALREKHNAGNKSSYDYFKPLNIEFSNPITTFDFSKIILTENKDTIKCPIDADKTNICQGDTILRKFTVDYKWKEGMNYSLTVLPAAFRDVFNLPNDTLQINFKTAELKEYGNVVFKIKTVKNYDHIIAQLVNDNDAVMAEKSLEADGSVKFSFVRPGNYKLKLIIDSNNNGKWDTGNYLKKIQPEKVFYDPTAITVKANWDMELEWTVVK